MLRHRAFVPNASSIPKLRLSCSCFGSTSSRSTSTSTSFAVGALCFRVSLRVVTIFGSSSSSTWCCTRTWLYFFWCVLFLDLSQGAARQTPGKQAAARQNPGCGQAGPMRCATFCIIQMAPSLAANTITRSVQGLQPVQHAKFSLFNGSLYGRLAFVHRGLRSARIIQFAGRSVELRLFNGSLYGKLAYRHRG